MVGLKEPDCRDLQPLIAAVETATAAYREAQTAESAARSRCTDALNRLNEAQKKLDAALDGIRKAAPNDSDWSRKAFGTRGVAV